MTSSAKCTALQSKAAGDQAHPTSKARSNMLHLVPDLHSSPVTQINSTRHSNAILSVPQVVQHESPTTSSSLFIVPELLMEDKKKSDDPSQARKATGSHGLLVIGEENEAPEGQYMGDDY